MERDRQLARWVGRLGAVEVRHVQERFGVGRSVAYDLIARLSKAGLVERVETLRGEPTLIRATVEGLGFAELGLPVASVRLGELFHWIACADVCLWAERRFGEQSVLSEPEIRLAERLEGRPVVSAAIGELSDGRTRLHRPDLALIAGERPIAIEVELTPKAPARLKAIIKGWRRARHVEQVIYLCSPGPTQQGVERAVAETHADDRISVIEIQRAT